MRLVLLCDRVVEYTHTRTSVLQPYVIFHYFSNCVEYRHLRFIFISMLMSGFDRYTRL